MEGWLRPGRIRMGIRREEEKITGRGWGWCRIFSGFFLFPGELLAGASKSIFSSDIQGPLSHGFGKMGLEGRHLTVHSLATSFPACSHLGVLFSSLWNSCKGSQGYSQRDRRVRREHAGALFMALSQQDYTQSSKSTTLPGWPSLSLPWQMGGGTSHYP